jgi:hypothetical protein
MGAMDGWNIARRARTTGAAVLLAAGAMSGLQASQEQAARAAVTAAFPANAGLYSVSATSATNAWAVGFRFGGLANRRLAEHWNGSSWKQVKTLSPGGVGDDAEFRDVSALSKNNVWAVGFFSDGTIRHSLIEHWNGKAWKQFKAPVQGCTPGDGLSSVTAISPANVWAVGTVTNCFALVGVPDAFHWNGRSWHEVPPPNPGQLLGGELQSVAATSAHDVWAVGDFPTGQAQGRDTLTAHWNGSKWKLVPSPNPTGLLNVLTGVSATSGSNAWAVGFDVKNIPHANFTLALHWNGTSWTRVPTPHPAGGNGDLLDAVAALSGHDAFAVGEFRNAKNRSLDLSARWNGRSWSMLRSPTPPPPGQDAGLTGVAATSGTNAWAVGFYRAGSASKAIIVHWNGKSWHRQV